MLQILHFALFIAISLTSARAFSASPAHTDLSTHTDLALPFNSVKVFKVLGSEGKDLSGLAICDNKIYAVADNINPTIFELTLSQYEARLLPAITLPSVPPIETNFSFIHRLYALIDGLRGYGDRYDWEGLACDSQYFYLVSERKLGVLKTNLIQSEWLVSGIYTESQTKGYAQTYNAFTEAIVIEDESIHLFFERQPRGALKIDRQSRQKSYHTLPEYADLEFVNGSVDVAGAAISNGAIYTLERNASSVCRHNSEDYTPEICYTYTDTENNPKYQYKNSDYKLGEGLAMDDSYIYVVFDNNRKQRVLTEDTNGLLLKIERPEGF